MIVGDSNILAYLYLPGDFNTRAEALLEQDPDWAAPLLWRSEFRNILAGYLRRGNLTFDATVAIQQEAEALMQGAEFEVDSRKVLELVHTSNCSAYDCEFVALARQLNVKLVTMDKKVLQGFSSDAMPLHDE